MKGRMLYIEDDLRMMESGDWAWVGILALQHYLALWAEFGKRYGE